MLLPFRSDGDHGKADIYRGVSAGAKGYVLKDASNRTRALPASGTPRRNLHPGVYYGTASGPCTSLPVSASGRGAPNYDELARDVATVHALGDQRQHNRRVSMPVTKK